MRQFFQDVEDWDHKICPVYPLRKGAEQFEHLISNRRAMNIREPFMKAELIPYLLLHTSSLSLIYIYMCIYTYFLSLLYIYIYMFTFLYLSFVYSILSSFSPLLPMPYSLSPIPPFPTYCLFPIYYYIRTLSLYIYIVGNRE